MRARIAVAVAVVGGMTLGITLVRCDGNGGVIADAGDAALDHGRDIGSLDTGSGTSDAGVDGVASCSVTSDWPGFRRLTEFDPCLPADVLVDQDAGFSMNWTDCGDAGITGCAELSLAGTPSPIAAYATHDDGGSGLALALVQDQPSSYTQVDAFDIRDRSRLGEWRIDVGKANGTFVGLADAPDPTADFLGWKSTGFVAATGSITALANSNPMPLEGYPAPSQNINWAVSANVMAFQLISAPYTICTVGAGTCAPMNIQSIAPATPYLTFAWRDVVFAVAEHGTTGWAQEYVIHADGSIALLRSNPNAHIWAMETDGTTLVWKEVYGSQNLSDAQTSAEVWKAPFTTDKATLDATATKIATLPSAGLGGGPVLGEAAFFNGLYATYFGGYPYQFTIYTVDVTSGQVQSSPTGPGGIMLGLPYVDRSELWEVTSSLAYQDHLVRVPFSQPWN